MLRWSDEQHQAWKDREAKRCAEEQSTSGPHPEREPIEMPAQRTGPLTLPWPPSGQHSHGHANNRRYLLPAVKEYRAAVARICADRAPITGPYRLHLVLSPPDKRRRDADNAIKAALDALVHAGYLADDSMTYMRELSVVVQDEMRYGWILVTADPCA